VTEQTVLARREFLTKLTSVVSGTATLAVASSLAQASPILDDKPTEIVDIPKAKGYQRTKHVDTYYQLADF
jgi:hypothetical protein